MKFIVSLMALGDFPALESSFYTVSWDVLNCVKSLIRRPAVFYQELYRSKSRRPAERFDQGLLKPNR